MSPYRRAVETRRLYRFEEVFTRQLPLDIRRSRPIAELRDIAACAWTGEDRAADTLPQIVASRGVLIDGTRCSVSWNGRVELMRQHRNVRVLFHELAHEMGHRGHGRGFVDQYVELLCAYGGCEEGELRLGLSLFNIR